MVINYNEAAVSYSTTRNIEPIVYTMLCHILRPIKSDLILDFGCGTGNYLKQLSSDFGISSYGVEPSDNMRTIARNKCVEAQIESGDHTHIPFRKGIFNKAYSIDVIHHIQCLEEFFRTIYKATSCNACLCICTESPQQLDKKYWLKYFSSISKIDHMRFHRIENIISAGEKEGWINKEILSADSEITAPISSDFMKRIEEKSLSILHLISHEEYESGFNNMISDYKYQTALQQREGYTFLRFEKEDT